MTRGIGPSLMGLLALLTVAVVGCGERGPERITGTVTFEGQALDEGTIQFEPAGKGASSQSGGKIEDGKFDVPGAKGLMPGEYRVRIFSQDKDEKVTQAGEPIPGMGGGAFVYAERIPPKYNIESEEIVEVKEGGPNDFDITIE